MDQSSRSRVTEIQVRPAGTHRSLYCRFAVREARLIVEVDGATHSEDRKIAYDRRREVFLKAEGHQIVRVRSGDVYRHINDVLDLLPERTSG